jgi:hypothetical protein
MEKGLATVLDHSFTVLTAQAVMKEIALPVICKMVE